MARLAVIGVAIVLGSIALCVWAPGPSDALVPSPWWVAALIAVGFVVAHLVVFHLEFRLDAVIVSITEVPMVFALVFVDLPTAVVIAVLCGTVTSLAHRRPASYKVAFNACVYVGDIAVAWFVFRAIVGPNAAGARGIGGVEDPGRVVIAAVIAAAVTSLIAAVFVCAAIAQFAGGFVAKLRDDALPTSWVFGLSGLLSGLTLAPALVSPWLTPLAFVPIAAMWLLVRQHGLMRARFTDLEAVHGFAAEIADEVDLQLMIDQAVVATARLLHARRAAIVLFDGDSVVGTAAHGGPIPGLPTRATDPAWAAMGLGAQDRSAPVLRRDGSLAAIVRGDGGDVGVLLVDGREGVSNAFDEGDAQRLQTLADQLAAGVGRGLLHRRLEHEATHDLLTGLANRAHFEHVLDDRRTTTDHPGRAFLVMFDLDRFKEVNDTLGHHAGDQVLVQFARRIGLLLAPDDLLARFAGDEFALFGHRADADAIDEFLRACIDATGRPFALDGLEVVVTVSAGVALAKPDDDPAELVRRADVAMYHAKTQHLGHDFHREEIDRRTPARLSMLTDLRAAIHGDEIQLHFQPKLDLVTNRVSGVEALARWHHPTRGWVPPVDFIKVAEESGLIRSLTDHVIGAAVEALARLHACGHALGLAVNLSTQDLFDELLGDRIERRLDQFGIPADLLTFEITEGSLLVDGPRTRSTIDRLHRIGVRLSIDDFGTGYSSLSYLRMLPVTELKIDRSFVTDLLTEQQDEVIVRSTIDLGHNLGMTVVAEGAESRAVIEQLRTMGCDLVQGFGIARPMPLGALEQWLVDGLGPPLESRPPESLAVEATSVS